MGRGPTTGAPVPDGFPLGLADPGLKHHNCVRSQAGPLITNKHTYSVLISEKNKLCSHVVVNPDSPQKAGSHKYGGFWNRSIVECIATIGRYQTTMSELNQRETSN